ncbi:MAG: hypothetical protein ACI4DR_08965 [Roseburia sp.]
MGRTKKIRKLFLVALLFGMIAMPLSGCGYYNNKSWDDMTPEEQEEVRQHFKEERKYLEDRFSNDSVDDRFVQYILDKVEQAIESSV